MPESSPVEVNFDGLVGPTHNYAGLSYGNVASMAHGGRVSNPRAAALEGLAKMRLFLELGVVQAVLPPQERPDVGALRALGFSGSDARVLEGAARDAPELLAACASASSMWAANAATVSPSADTADGRLHLTPANLITHFHRSLEPPTTERVLRAIFPDPERFCVHPPLPAATHLADEGAANHIRMAPDHGAPGLEVFVYGRRAFGEAKPGAQQFPARQAREASRAVARRHGLVPGRTLFLRQHPKAVDLGVFHADVISVANERVLFCHEGAFAETGALEQIRETFRAATGQDLILLTVAESRLPLKDAVATYLFNSQLVTLPAGGMALVAPAECEGHPLAARVLGDVVEGDNPIREIHFVDVRQSMENGGGPACLRLRVVLTPRERAALHPDVLLTEALHARLVRWVERHYRDRLSSADLADPTLLEEGHRALDELSELLRLGSLYPFQTAAA